MITLSNEPSEPPIDVEVPSRERTRKLRSDKHIGLRSDKLNTNAVDLQKIAAVKSDMIQLFEANLHFGIFDAPPTINDNAANLFVCVALDFNATRSICSGARGSEVPMPTFSSWEYRSMVFWCHSVGPGAPLMDQITYDPVGVVMYEFTINVKEKHDETSTPPLSPYCGCLRGHTAY
jgi:hypothetical protein